LVRRLSIETGILEGLYGLDRETTEVLVAHGFNEDFVPRTSTNIEPGRLIDILRDHEAAIQLVIDCVTKSRPLTKGLMHELQSILTRHQDSTTAIDGLGRRFEIPLSKGKFKHKPNNPKRPDGSIHGYCPPIHVAAEVDNLLSWLADYSSEDPVLVAAWLHHRFTQIHPYQDGNGRVARALTTLVLLRADLLPLIVDRDLRNDYINALESADQSSLAPLAEMFSRLERNAILQALSVERLGPVAGTSAAIAALTVKIGKRNSSELTELRRVNSVAELLKVQASTIIARSFEELEPALSHLGSPVLAVSSDGLSMQEAAVYQDEVWRSASEVEIFANFAEEHHFVSGLIRVNTASLSFVLSLHHIGREVTGIMQAIAFSKLGSGRFSLCSTEPFVFTHLSDLSSLEAPFATWLDDALGVALTNFIDRL